MSTGFSSMDLSGSARRSLKDYFCGRCPAFSSASCVNSPTDWFDIYFHSNLTIISCTQSYHITWCRSGVHLFQYCWTRQWWVTGLQGWSSSFLQAQTIRMFVATCIFWAQYHTIFDIVFLNMILLMETLPEFSFPIFLAYSTEYAN